MGSGIALSIKTMYPDAYKAYKFANLKLGEITHATVNRNGKPFTIINVNGQANFSTHTRQTNYEALFTGLQHARNLLKDSHLTLGIPFNMGCARGGGDWRIVERLIEVAFDTYLGNVVIVEYDGVVNYLNRFNATTVIS